MIETEKRKKLKKESAVLRVLKDLLGGVFVSLQAGFTKSGFGMLGRCFDRKEKERRKKQEKVKRRKVKKRKKERKERIE